MPTREVDTITITTSNEIQSVDRDAHSTTTESTIRESIIDDDKTKVDEKIDCFDETTTPTDVEHSVVVVESIEMTKNDKSKEKNTQVHTC